MTAPNGMRAGLIAVALLVSGCGGSGAGIVGAETNSAGDEDVIITAEDFQRIEELLQEAEFAAAELRDASEWPPPSPETPSRDPWSTMRADVDTAPPEHE